MKVSNQQLRQNAQNKLRGNYGQGIVAAVVPGIISGIAVWIFGLMTANSIIITNIMSVSINAIASFMVITMVLRLARNHKDARLGDSLSPGDRLLQFVVYALLMGIIAFAVQLPVNYIFFNDFFASETAINDALSTMDPENLTEIFGLVYGYIGSILLVSIVFGLIIIKFTYTTYIIVDEGLSFPEAMKKSWRLTNGNVFRIIFMNLSFIGWYLLVIITCGIGIFYVAPYHNMALMNLYLVIKEENGESINMYDPSNDSNPVTNDWMNDEQEVTNEEPKNNNWDF